MTLFFLSWKGETSLLINAADEAGAVHIGSAVYEGAVPSKVTAVPAGVFVAEVFWGPDEDDDADEGDPCQDVFQVEPFEHTMAALELLEEGAPREPPCGAEADDTDGAPLLCERAKDHAPPHESLNPITNVISEWT